jgi:sugar phosphate permease
MGVMWTAYIVVFIHRLSIGPLSPFIKAEWDLSNTQIGGLVTAAVIGTMVSILPAGWITDRIGIKKILFIGEIVAGCFMMTMWQIPTYQMALIIMGFTGFGCGLLMPATTKGVLVWFPRNERAVVMGIKQTAVNAGGMISAAILPTIAIALGWRFGFLIVGIIAFSIGITSLILYKDPPSIASTDDTANEPTTPPSRSISLKEFLKARDVWFLALGGFALVAVEFGVLAQLVLYLTEDLLLPVVAAAGLLALTEGGGIVGKPLSGILSDRFFGTSRKKVFLLWASIACVMCLIIAFFGDQLGWGMYPVLFIFGVCGIGWGGLHLTLTGELAGSELAGRVTGIVNFIAEGGIAIGPLLFGYLVDTTGSYQPAWFFCVGFSVLSIIALLFVREERRRL